MEERRTDAIKMRNLYFSGHAFPEWVIDPKIWPTHAFADTKVFYHKADSLAGVKRLCLEREPCNIGMDRRYDIDGLQSTFGWRTGAYTAGMPNMAIYCKATVYTEKRGFFNAHVLNLIGCAMDSPQQPDSQTYDTQEKVLAFYQRLWRLALGAMKQLGKSKFQIYNVGGGAFSGRYGTSFTMDIFEPAFLPLLPEFSAAGIQVIGYDTILHKPNGGLIPDCLDKQTQDLENTVFVNAWDPWSLIGNGNEYDRSLDGYWGRCSNMSVLGWLQTNPEMQFCPIP